MILVTKIAAIVLFKPAGIGVLLPHFIGIIRKRPGNPTLFELLVFVPAVSLNRNLHYAIAAIASTILPALAV